MKSYHDAVKRLAKEVFSNHMSGSFSPWYGVDYGLVADLYDAPDMHSDIQAEVDRMINAQVDSYRDWESPGN